MVCHGDISCKDAVERGNFCKAHYFLNVCLLPDLLSKPRKFAKQIQEITGKSENFRRHKSAVLIQAHWRRVLVRNRLADPRDPLGQRRLHLEFQRFQ